MAGKSSKSEAELVDPVAAAQLGNGPLPGGEVVGVDKIRDLLFGNQMQDYDRRFSKLEERFLQRFKDIEFGDGAQPQRLRIEREEAGGVAREPAPRREGPARRYRQGDRADAARA